ncbi:MAG TPA: DUF1206 domain-containing protein [Propionibacteriaceae bacterium]|nr:DUF1206 domain-containing protein [Propionibacteriaceae bacterium]
MTDSRVVTAGARAGYAVNGVLHLLIAVLALQIAFGGRGAKADPSGAMGLAASTPVGLVVLIAIVVGFGLLAVWQIGEVIRGPRTRDRLKAAAKAIVYLALAFSAVSFLMGRGNNGQRQASDLTATLMKMPLGPVLVVLAGLVVAGVGVYHIIKGWTERFRRDLASSPSRFTMVAGKVGYIARGVAFIAVGIGIVVAGVTHHPDASRGLDGALHDMVALPWGQALVALVALGFAAYGFYSFSRAHRART